MVTVNVFHFYERILSGYNFYVMYEFILEAAMRLVVY